MKGDSFDLVTCSVTMKLIPALASRLPSVPLDGENQIVKMCLCEEVILVHGGVLLKLHKHFVVLRFRF